jgi:hypothetical protein
MPEQRSLQITKAKRELAKQLRNERGFVGAGVASDESGQPAIVVFVEQRESPVLKHVPSTWKGYAVRAEISGRPRKFGRT